MAVKNIVIPWLTGGAILFGYAAFAWSRRRPPAPRLNSELSGSDYEPTSVSDRLPHLSEDEVLESEPAPLPSHAGSARHVELGARFLGRASSAFSPFQNQPARTSTADRKF